MPNAEANPAQSTDRTSNTPEKINAPNFDVSELLKSLGDITKQATGALAGFPPAESLLPPDGGNKLPQDIKVGNVPGPGSGSGGDNGFGPAPAWARAFDRKDLPQDINFGDVPGPGSRAPGKKIDTIPDKLPGSDAIDPNRERQGEKPGDKAEQQRQENARQAADILGGRGDFGNEFQRGQIKDMYNRALQEGGQAAADKLTEAINKELEKRGSNLRVTSHMELGTPEQPGDFTRLKVMKGSQQVDEAKVFRPNMWLRRGGLENL